MYGTEELLDLAWDHQQGAAYETFAASDQAEVLECKGCGKPTLQLTWIGDGWNFQGCAECVAECARQLEEELEREPECSCIQTDVDFFDARGCELHDRRSEYNQRLRAVTSVQQYESFPEVA